jgi:hypothetical protein
VEEVHGHTYGLTPNGMARELASHLKHGVVNANCLLELRRWPVHSAVVESPIENPSRIISGCP